VTAGRTAAAVIAAVVTLSGCSAVSAIHAATSDSTFRADNATCEPLDSGAKICGFLAYYGNSSDHPINVDASGTLVVDSQGRTFAVDDGSTSGDTASQITAFGLNPGAQQFMEWQVELPADAQPVKIRWNGFTVGWVAPSPTPSQSSAVLPDSSAATAVAPGPLDPAPPSEVPQVEPSSAESTGLASAPPSAPSSLPAPPTSAPTTRRSPAVHTTHPAVDATNPQDGSGSIG
jgi:hypothetical protein